MNQAFALPVPSGHATLEQYIHTVNSIPLLSAEEEHDLAQRHALEDDLEAAKKLILAHLRVVVSIARGYDGLWFEPSRFNSRGQYRPDESRKTF